jgi:hypothetical protein
LISFLASIDNALFSPSCWCSSMVSSMTTPWSVALNLILSPFLHSVPEEIG